jgi:hypothetical protein
MNLEDLKKVFPDKDVEWRVQQDGSKDGKVWALIVPYITNRAIQDRLDQVCSPENWKNEYRESGTGFICGISIYFEGKGWVTKYDGADKTNIEPLKGGLSDSMKRAAVQWGIGRYLYSMSTEFAVIAENGKYRGKCKTKDGDIYYKWNPPVINNAPALPEPTENEIIKAIKGIKDIKTEDELKGYFIKHVQPRFTGEPLQRLIDQLSIRKAEIKAVSDANNQ